MKSMTGATLIKIVAAEVHMLLPRCIDHPALVDVEAAKAEVAADDALLLLKPIELIVVGLVAVGSRVAVMMSVGVPSIKAVAVTEVIERDVAVTVEGTVEAEDVDELSGEEIRVMAKEGLVSPESPNKTMR